MKFICLSLLMLSSCVNQPKHTKIDLNVFILDSCVTPTEILDSYTLFEGTSKEVYTEIQNFKREQLINQAEVVSKHILDLDQRFSYDNNLSFCDSERQLIVLAW